jgi:hypothetical protein
MSRRQLPDGGENELNEFLLGYRRTTLKRACTQTKRLKGLGPGLIVWLYRAGRWDRLPDDVVEGLWGANSMQKDRSLCSLLLKDVFQLNSDQYRDVRRAFESDQVPGLTGIYKAVDVTKGYAIVVELPDEVASNSNIQNAGIAALAALAVGTTAAARKFQKDAKKAASSSVENEKKLTEQLQSQAHMDLDFNTQLNQAKQTFQAQLKLKEAELATQAKTTKDLQEELQKVRLEGEKLRTRTEELRRLKPNSKKPKRR